MKMIGKSMSPKLELMVKMTVSAILHRSKLPVSKRKLTVSPSASA